MPRYVPCSWLPNRCTTIRPLFYLVLQQTLTSAHAHKNNINTVECERVITKQQYEMKPCMAVSINCWWTSKTWSNTNTSNYDNLWGQRLWLLPFVRLNTSTRNLYTKILQSNYCFLKLLPRRKLEYIQNLRTVEWFDLFYCVLVTFKTLSAVCSS